MPSVGGLPSTYIALRLRISAPLLSAMEGRIELRKDSGSHIPFNFFVLSIESWPASLHTLSQRYFDTVLTSTATPVSLHRITSRSPSAPENTSVNSATSIVPSNARRCIIIFIFIIVIIISISII